MTNLLLDTDPGCDDAVALVFALEHPAIELVGVSSIFGNAEIADTTRNTRAVLELFDRQHVPVARGASKPLLTELDTAEHIHGEGGIKGPLPVPTTATEPVDIHAAEFIIKKAYEYEGELTLAAVGRMTNVALAMALEPELPELLDELLIMGGTVFENGNVTPLAGANLYGDPHASRRVVRDGNPTIVGLDVTQHSSLPAGWIESLPKDSQQAKALYEWVTYYSQEDLDRYGIETSAIHDALALAYLVEPDILQTETHYLEVGADEGLAQGALVCDTRGTTGKEPNGSVALGVDADRYRELVTKTLDQAIGN